MKLFDMFNKAPANDLPRKKGVSRYFETLWDHLGKLFLLNLLCFIGFLPLVLLVSLGDVYDNFWIAAVGGAIGGAVAGPFWTAALATAFLCFKSSCFRWFGYWLEALKKNALKAAAQGAVIGGIFGGLIIVWNFAGELMNQGILPAAPVWVFMAMDFFVLAAASALLFPPLCFEKKTFKERLLDIAELAKNYPLRLISAVTALLLWAAVFVALFPTCVPFAAIFGFSPLALLLAQILEKWTAESSDIPDAASEGGANTLTTGRKIEVVWLKCGPLILGAVIIIGIAASVLWTTLNTSEPDLQIAVVHSNALPDDVISKMENSVEQLIDDLNGDGNINVQINDYTVSFDGQETDANVQTSGTTGLVTDISAGISCIFIVEDSNGFLSWYGDKVNSENALSWEEYPQLSSLDIGVYSVLEDIYTDHNAQELLTGYTVYPALAAEEKAEILLKTQNPENNEK